MGSVGERYSVLLATYPRGRAGFGELHSHLDGVEWLAAELRGFIGM